MPRFQRAYRLESAHHSKGRLDRWEVERLIPSLMKAKAARLKKKLDSLAAMGGVSFQPLSLAKLP
jgi:hypothetical protein